MTADEILESLSEECRVDHVGLWEIVDSVRVDLGSTDATEVRELALRLVRGLVLERGMQVGQPAPDGRRFVAWDMSPDQAVDQIEREWSALGRDPDIGEVAWFTSAQATPSKRQIKPA